ncbi:MAG TPA: PqqD family protein [Pyrinomonadaceae bacterium]
MPVETNPKSLQKDLVIQELEDEVLIYDLRKNKAHCLNHTAAFVWQHADGETPVKQIAHLLQRKLRTPVDESVVWFALEQLAKEGLLENKIAAPQMFAEMNRRTLITTLGKSAAVAIPMIFAITAPTAAQTGSCVANGQNCPGGDGLECCSGFCNGVVCATRGGGGGINPG